MNQKLLSLVSSHHIADALADDVVVIENSLFEINFFRFS